MSFDKKFLTSFNQKTKTSFFSEPSVVMKMLVRNAIWQQRRKGELNMYETRVFKE